MSAAALALIKTGIAVAAAFICASTSAVAQHNSGEPSQEIKQQYESGQAYHHQSDDGTANNLAFSFVHNLPAGRGSPQPIVLTFQPNERDGSDESLKDAAERQREEEDLQAQKDMAFYACLTVWISVFSLGASIFSVIMVYLSLRQTATAIRDNREIGEAQVNPFIAVELGQFVFDGRGVIIDVLLANHGNSPAEYVKLNGQIRLSRPFPKGALVPTRRWKDFPLQKSAAIRWIQPGTNRDVTITISPSDIGKEDMRYWRSGSLGIDVFCHTEWRNGWKKRLWSTAILKQRIMAVDGEFSDVIMGSLHPVDPDFVEKDEQ